MKDQDPLSHQTATLLRAPLPETEARPGFETRLLAHIQNAPAEPSLLPRYLTGAACALLLLGLIFVIEFQKSSPPETPLTTSNPSLPVMDWSALPNPLETEAEAMRSTATRAGRVLLSQLPSLPDSGESL